MKDNRINEQLLDLNEEQLQDVTGGLQGAPAPKSVRTRRNQPVTGGSDNSLLTNILELNRKQYEIHQKKGEELFAQGDHQGADKAFDQAHTHIINVQNLGKVMGR